jgi:hypothetical protein
MRSEKCPAATVAATTIDVSVPFSKNDPSINIE